ncbi:hypothetical protein FA13DRAFT_1717222 [Coprinellus micaceus]|uniref:Uncharacterized protein n=1 Tax=Coprinellus micaceus TaxID=71717 RepID=A0A4Y7SH14_COPMI|nr:hypothetical protein FA13DRAFT_1717222 [Coprinellus micaceus]
MAAFYPINADWTGSHFRRVLLSNLSLRAAIHGPTHDGSFQLEPSISEAWSRLENAVVRILDCLLPHLSLPYSITLPPYPSSNSYSKFFPSEDTAYEAVRRSRNAFHELAAVLSFVSSFWSKPHSTRPMHLLSRYLSHALALDFEWVATLLSFPPVCPNAGHQRNFKTTPSSGSATAPSSNTLLSMLSKVTAVTSVIADDSSFTTPSLPKPIPKSLYKIERYIGWSTVQHLDYHRTKDLGSYDEHDSEAHRKLSKFAIYEWTGEHGHCRRNPIDPRHFLTMLRAYPLNSRYVSLLHSEIDFFKASQQLSLITPTSENHTTMLLLLLISSRSPPTHPIPPHASESHRSLSSHPLLPSLPQRTLQIKPRLSSPHSSRAILLIAPCINHPKPFELEYRAQTKVGYHHDASRHLSPPVPNPLHAKFPDDVRGIHRSLRVLGLHPEVHSLQMSREAVMSCLYAVQALHDHKSGIYDLPVQFDLSAGDLWHRLRRTFNVEEVVSTYDKVDVHSKDKKLLTVTEYKYALGSYDRPMDQQCFVLILDAFALVEGYYKSAPTLPSTALRTPPLDTIPLRSIPPTVPSLERVKVSYCTGKPFSEARYNAYEHKRDEVLTGNRRRTCVEGGRYLRFKNSDAQESVTLWPARPNWELMWINTNAWNQEAEAWFNDQVRAWRTPLTNERTKDASISRPVESGDPPPEVSPKSGKYGITTNA